MDAYEVLGLERGLVIADEAMREAFREAGRRAHPDAGGSEDGFAQVQQAFALLSSPAARLRHWLGLAGIGVSERGAVPAGMVEMFGELGEVMQRAEDLGRRREAARSALGRALLEPELQAARDRLEHAVAAVDAAIAAEVARFPAIEAGMSADAGEVLRVLMFLEKWRSRLRERFAALV